MRWLWLDRFTEFQSGSHAKGIKNVALDEEAIDNYSPGHPFLPPTLIIEGIAQLSGILVAEHFDFKKRVVLAKVNKAVYHQLAQPGDQLEYAAQLDFVQEQGATCRCTSHINGELQAEIDLMFAFLDEKRFGDQSLFEDGDLLVMLRLMKLFHVAVDADGQPLAISSNL
ncbi:3-hydroxyacyl-[acyl-carrier-protein] dehydratase FabZ [Roseimaritima multifibrata]|uniref:3-hydroxyacyl-[acyl-carrier-protein] dehydratase FabZ n=1 Tax=Roseimaritima multifibrata TaxID=1930274 RepID=A0A517M8U2_9BACT|nr:3-hydroxyacyl-ACP dehydratase FabZ family protein [Roseimaritima multifibrata]QDS91284.1 3-hydroxyacyl-[acyl-carrier-protein] dehydratase FabZ [Roseimaritima multifibrata]